MEKHAWKENEWVGLGDSVEVTASRQVSADKEFQKRYEYAIKSESHLWVVTLCHYAGDSVLNALYDDSYDTPILDSESLAMRPCVACYICEEVYERRLWHRRCKGEPKN